MQDISVSLTVVVFLALIALLVAAVAAPVEVVDSLQSVNAVPRSGTTMVVQEMLNLSFTTYEAEKIGRFRFRNESEGPLVIYALVTDSLPVSADATMPEDDETQMENIVLGESGATLVRELRDDPDGSPVPGDYATLLVDPAGLANEDRRYWLHYRASRQRPVTSAVGNARFTGMAPKEAKN